MGATLTKPHPSREIRFERTCNRDRGRGRLHCGLHIGAVLADRYVVHTEIGEGGQSIVLECWDKVARAAVAVKRTELKNAKNYSRSRNEVDLLQLCKKATDCSKKPHFNVVPLLDWFDGFEKELGARCRYLVMPLAELDLATYASQKRLNSSRPTGISDKEGMQLLCQISQALCLLKSKQIFHRDVKPANIVGMQNHHGDLHWMLLDLGMSIRFDAAPYTGVGGTQGYLAPELYMGHPFTAAADAWALGCTMVEALTGELLFPVRGTLEAFSDMMYFTGGPDTALWETAPCRDELSNAAYFKCKNRPAPYARLDALLHGRDPLLVDVTKGLLVCDPTKRMTVECVVDMLEARCCDSR